MSAVFSSNNILHLRTVRCGILLTAIDLYRRQAKVVSGQLTACESKLGHAQRKLEAGCLPIDPSIAPLFDLMPLRLEVEHERRPIVP